MKVFVTGATGFVGSATVQELLTAGHQVVGLVRSDEGAASLAAKGVEVLRGSLDDLDSLRRGAESADGVIHTAFIHDFVDMVAAAATDRLAVETMCGALAGSNRPFVMASGAAGLAPGRLATEQIDPPTMIPRGATEKMAVELASEGVRVAVVRLPPTVHGEGDHGFVPRLVTIAREKGVSGYPGDGSNRWAAVHRVDAARVFRLALENAPAGTRYHAIDEEGVPVRNIAEIIGRHLNVPVVSVGADQVSEHFGWLGRFFSADMQISSAWTQQQLGWHPTELSLLEDLDHDYYFQS